MIKLTTWDDSLSGRQIDQVVTTLQSDGIIIMPTDTMYAIACDALQPKAISTLCKIKNINPEKTNLSIICPTISFASAYARWDNWAFPLLRDNTPGPFTFLFRSAPTLPKEFKRRKIVGIRIPAMPLCRQIAEALGHPLLTSTIPYSDEDYATSPDLMAEHLEGKTNLIINAGPGSTELSTIVDCTGHEPLIIRQGKGLLS